MSDAQTLKKLSKAFGTEVVGFQTTFAMAAPKADAVRDQFLQLIRERNIPTTQIQRLENMDKMYFTISKTISTVPKEVATTAVRIAPYGNDLWVEVRHYERSSKSESNKNLLGILLTVGGLLFIWTGVGLLVLVVGIAMLVSKSQFPDPSAQRDESKLLLETVTETLLVALTNCDVDAGAQIKTDF